MVVGFRHSLLYNLFEFLFLEVYKPEMDSITHGCKLLQKPHDWMEWFSFSGHCTQLAEQQLEKAQYKNDTSTMDGWAVVAVIVDR